MDHDRSSTKLLLIVLFSIILSCYCYDSSANIEEAKDAELESQLKILNKTPIKTIKTEEGDVYDCIDINNQPSLDHPLLKNHIIKSRPISHSINTMVDDVNHEATVLSSSSSSSSSSSLKASIRTTMLKKFDCPDGTVPIRRTSKEDIIRVKLFPKLKSIDSINVGDQRHNLNKRGQGEFFSVASTSKVRAYANYTGIQARINMYNPLVTRDQVSTAQLWIENWHYEEELNSLQAGWIVAPSLYGDWRTRLFGKWQVDGSNKSEGCYDILCPGFIQVDKSHPIGSTVGPISQYGNASEQYDIRVAISRDDGGNWWLDVEDLKLGYWPAELGFSMLTQGSPAIAWGGLAAQLGAVTTPVPPTGNEHFPHPYFIFERQCYMRQMKVIPTTTQYWEDPTKDYIESYATKKKCSNVVYYGHRQDKVFAHTLAFGGSGGNCQF